MNTMITNYTPTATLIIKATKHLIESKQYPSRNTIKQVNNYIEIFKKEMNRELTLHEVMIYVGI